MNARQSHILIVEDEPSIAGLIATVLHSADYLAVIAQNAAQAHVLIADQAFDLIVLDWMLPLNAKGEGSGIDIAHALRCAAKTRSTPILMLTAKHEEADIIAGLDAGADDYMQKPFSPKELLARIKALLRRAAPALSSNILEYGGLILQPEEKQAKLADGREVKLKPSEFDLLYLMLLQPHRVHTRSGLLSALRGADARTDERAIDAHIKGIRAALAKFALAGLILTERGLGYRVAA